MGKTRTRKRNNPNNNNLCKTVAVRFYFDFKLTNGKPQISFVPHKVIVHKIEEPKFIFVNDVEYLRKLEPLEWKQQDHYRVLGISNMRYDAPEEVIKSSYKSIVLKHHPDKRPTNGREIKSDEDYFMCITMAYEVLSEPKKRRSYDSVDPKFDNSLPSDAERKKDFYKTFDYYFRLNSRWSEKKPVPEFGDGDTLRVNVDRFYNFWYNFESWREYSYEDEEDKTQCEDRYERRECDKINKVQRQRKKKEEMTRIRNLVDMAYKNDPRIIKFKQEDNEKKFAGRKARQAAAQAKKDEEERLVREATAAKEELEAAERANTEAKRQEREAQKKAMRRQRKMFRDTCKSNNYYTQNEDEIFANVQAVERVCQQFSVMQLKELNNNLQNNGRETFLQAVNDCNVKF